MNTGRNAASSLTCQFDSPSSGVEPTSRTGLAPAQPIGKDAPAVREFTCLVRQKCLGLAVVAVVGTLPLVSQFFRIDRAQHLLSLASRALVCGRPLKALCDHLLSSPLHRGTGALHLRCLGADCHAPSGQQVVRRRVTFIAATQLRGENATSRRDFESPLGIVVAAPARFPTRRRNS